MLSKVSGKNRLIGNVIFEHEGALMYCDSAWLYNKQNRIEAFENVRIRQGDTLDLWGDYLEYSGDTRKAIVTGEEVKLQDPKMTLTTTRLDYDRNTKLAYYSTGGHIVSDENDLVSKEGYYQSAQKIFNFKDSVILDNPRYVINSDTLIYHSDSRVAYFHGPTTITSDSSYIYCQNGVYNTVTDIAQFEKNAYLYDDNRSLTGDSLYYEKDFEFGEAFGHVRVHDTVENYLITGGYGRHLGQADSTFVTMEPIYSVLQDGDSLHIHGDTLLSHIQADSLGDYRGLQVFHGVKYFKSDLQGKSDSLSYSTRDSVIKMFSNPVIWSDSSQVTGDTIFLSMRNEKLDSLKVFGNAFILNWLENERYNQIKGRRMFGKFNKQSKLHRVFVNGNGQTLYYPESDDGSGYIGMNRAICSNLIIKLRDNEVRSVTFLTKPEAKLYPLKEVTAELARLEKFLNRFEEQPQKKSDILLE